MGKDGNDYGLRIQYTVLLRSTDNVCSIHVSESIIDCEFRVWQLYYTRNDLLTWSEGNYVAKLIEKLSQLHTSEMTDIDLREYIYGRLNAGLLDPEM